MTWLPEVIALTLERASELFTDKEDHKRRAWLASTCLVSSKWRNEAQRLLWRDLFLIADPVETYMIECAMRLVPARRHAVRAIKIQFPIPLSRDPRMVMTSLENFPRLLHLEANLETSALHTLVWQLPYTLRSITLGSSTDEALCDVLLTVYSLVDLTLLRHHSTMIAPLPQAERAQSRLRNLYMRLMGPSDESGGDVPVTYALVASQAATLESLTLDLAVDFDLAHIFTPEQSFPRLKRLHLTDFYDDPQEDDWTRFDMCELPQDIEFFELTGNDVLLGRRWSEFSGFVRKNGGRTLRSIKLGVYAPEVGHGQPDALRSLCETYAIDFKLRLFEE